MKKRESSSDTIRLGLLQMMFKRIDITVPDIPGHIRKIALYQQLMRMSIFIIIRSASRMDGNRHLEPF